MKHFLTTVLTLLLYCHVTLAAFCSDDEEAGECFEDKIKPMAIAATVLAFVFGISTVVLTVALLCKAKRRRRSKVMVYRKPYEKTYDNSGFERATQYYVKRPSERPAAAYAEPVHVVRNGQRPVVRDDLDVSDSLDMFAGEGKKEYYRSSDLVWVPGNGNGGKKVRAELNGNSSSYY